MENHTHYNGHVQQTTAARLLDLNREFYAAHARDFSETRLRLQRGVQRIVKGLRGDETILDLGCGNGELARALSRRGHRGSYVGLDFSLALLKEAQREPFSFPVQFMQADLAHLESLTLSHATSPAAAAPGAALPPATDSGWADSEHWSLITAFAVLHHIPSRSLRHALLERVHDWLEPDGSFIHSNWQFMDSPRFRARLQPWGTLGLTNAEVDTGDCLLDWRRGEKGLRYAHQFSEPELGELAAAGGFRIKETFYSDGADRRSGLYQVWGRD